MAFKTKRIKLADEDAISMSTPSAKWDGRVSFEVTIWRKLRTGDFEDLTYEVSMEPEDLACVLRRSKLGLQEAIDQLRGRAGELEDEL